MLEQIHLLQGKKRFAVLKASVKNKSNGILQGHLDREEIFVLIGVALTKGEPLGKKAGDALG